MRRDKGNSVFGNFELTRHGKSIQDAVRFYLAHLRRETATVPVPEALAAFLQEKRAIECRSARYMSDLQNRLGRFGEAFAKELIGALTPEAIVSWMDQRTALAASRNTLRRRLAAFFAYTVERKWRTENPFAGGRRAVIKRINEPRKKVKILSVDLSRRLLQAASPETLPFWAIALFAGLRPESEICRLRWEDIDFEQLVIVVDGSASENEETKTGRRVVKMGDNLVAWLQPLAQASGPVSPQGDTWRKLRADKREIGFGTPGRETPEEKAAGIQLQPWTPDITRPPCVTCSCTLPARGSSGPVGATRFTKNGCAISCSTAAI